MGKRPFLLLACMFLAGILTGAGFVWYLFPAAGMLSFCAGAWRGSGKRRWILCAGLLLFFAAGLFRAAGEEQFRQRYLPDLYDGQEIRLVGEIKRIEEKPKCICYILTDCVIDQSSVHIPCNDVAVYVSSGGFVTGQILVVKGSISLFDTAANEGGFDARQYYRSQKIDFGVWVDTVESVHGKGSRCKSLLLHIRRRLSDSIAASGGRDGVLAAMLLGEKDMLEAEVKSLYQRAGISHILAISGLHVSMLGIGIYKLLRRCRCSYAPACTATAVLMLSYAVMTGAGVSTRRAAGMLLVYLAADLLGYSYDMLSALALLVIVLLWDNPFLVGYSGFVFSVVAVLGVGVTAPVLVAWWQCWNGNDERTEKSDGRQKRKKNRRTLSEGLFASLGIQLTTLPLVAYYDCEIPVYAMIVNMLVLALIQYFLGMGITAAVAGLCSRCLGTVLMKPCNGILALYEWICQRTLRLPGARIITGFPGLGRVMCYYVLLGAALWMMRRSIRLRVQQEKEERQKCRRRTLQSYGKVVALVAALAFVLFVRMPKTFELDMLDVGQGDGIYLCTTDGVSMFVDGGSSDVTKVGSYRILPFLKYKGVPRISYWFVSHTDADHTSGLREVLQEGYRVEYLVFAELMRGEEKTQELAEIARACGTKVIYMNRGAVIRTRSADMRCVYPEGIAQWDGKECGEDPNELCLVLQFEDGDFCGMFTGDISGEVERELLSELQDLEMSVDFYKAAHHGSKYSNSYEWLQLLRPAVAAISCGANNRYGHPGEAAVVNMEDAGARVFCTTVCGRIRLRRIAGGALAVDGYLADSQTKQR